MARLVTYFIILGVTFFGCTFQPDGDELTEVPIPEPTATIMNFFENQDVLLVRGVFYTVLTPKSTEQVVGYRFLFDDVEVGKAPESPYSISLDTRKYTDGIHTVTLELTKLRDSQSIAAQAGLDT